MAKSVVILRDNLQEHVAVQAWRRVRGECFEPARVEIFRQGKKTGAYRLVGTGSNGSSVFAKRCHISTGKIEHMIYEELLPRLALPTLRCHGFLQEPEGNHCWMFLEDAGAGEYSPALAEHRTLAARWVGTVHQERISPKLQALLPDRGPSHYLQVLRSSRATMLDLLENPLLTVDDVKVVRTVVGHCDLIELHWQELETDFERWPSALVHGDFVIKNLRVQPRPEGPALLVFDWEMAGWGVPATDLAQVSVYCASPDLEVYRSVVQDSLRLSVTDTRRLSEYGNLLRVLDQIAWELFQLVGISYRHLVKPLRTLEKYEPPLAAALLALHWRSA